MPSATTRYQPSAPFSGPTTSPSLAAHTLVSSAGPERGRPLALPAQIASARLGCARPRKRRLATAANDSPFLRRAASASAFFLAAAIGVGRGAPVQLDQDLSQLPLLGRLLVQELALGVELFELRPRWPWRRPRSPRPWARSRLRNDERGSARTRRSPGCPGAGNRSSPRRAKR